MDLRLPKRDSGMEPVSLLYDRLTMKDEAGPPPMSLAGNSPAGMVPTKLLEVMKTVKEKRAVGRTLKGTKRFSGIDPLRLLAEMEIWTMLSWTAASGANKLAGMVPLSRAFWRMSEKKSI